MITCLCELRIFINFDYSQRILPRSLNGKRRNYNLIGIPSFLTITESSTTSILSENILKDLKYDLAMSLLVYLNIDTKHDN